MPDLSSLVTQQSSPPPQAGSSGSADASQMQSLMQQGQGPGGQPQDPSGQGGGPPPPPPSHKETVATLKHISAFDQRWRELLKDPGIGVKSIRPRIYTVMADLMGQGYCSMPQTLSLLKTFPAEPLEQKQWLEKHVMQDQQAMTMMLAHHAQGGSPTGTWAGDQALNGAGGEGLDDDHMQMMGQISDRYKAATPKKSIGGIPMKR
jgi:hypothetical protein